jgi:hypothetical protein
MRGSSRSAGTRPNGVRLLDGLLLQFGPRSWARGRLAYKLLLSIVVTTRR